MKLDTPQLMLSFEPDDARPSRIVLRVSHSEREYFESQRRGETYPIELPRPFTQTAFGESEGWRRNLRDGFAAADLGFQMWRHLPPRIANSMLPSHSNAPRRICILSQSSAIDDVPWEWLNAGPGMTPVAVSPDFHFVRLVPSLYGSPPLTIEPPIRVLMVVTNPKDESLLNSYEELRIVTSGLRGNDKYQITYLEEPRVENLQAALRASPHIVHYVGHAGMSGLNGALILHDHRDGTRWVSAAQIARSLPSSVRLLCLSTCVTAPNYRVSGLLHIAHSPSDRALPTTIVNQYALEPAAAETFWQNFYPRLIQSEGNVVTSFHEARAAVFQMDLPTWSWGSFSLVVRDGTGHPFRLMSEGAPARERSDTEIQAQWSARLANNLATRMQSLDPEARSIVAPSLDSEDARIDELRTKLDQM